MDDMLIDNRKIGLQQPVFVIAEAGVNHNGDLSLARKLVDASKAAGADAVKFQTFKAENLNTTWAPKANYHVETTGNSQSWFDLLKSQELTPKMHQDLMAHCKEVGIIFLSTPYDEESVDLLCDLGVGAFKIASTDANNIPLLKYIAKQKKPILLSTGMCTLKEVQLSVETIEQEGCRDYLLFHCTANYPTLPQDANLMALKTLQERFHKPVGFSDHTQIDESAVAAVALGAVAYEKHFTLDKNLPGPDHRMSADPEELKRIIQKIRLTQRLLGSAVKAPMASEMDNRQKLRKSLVAQRTIQKGEAISEQMVCCKRPGTGLAPDQLLIVLGKTANKDIPQDSLINLEDLE
jgi:N-acetylneuraminate synthase/N,N'-diacetyllegionaminate synthase